MNRYPLWKYALLGIALLVGLLYTVPNLYGESPAVQVSSGKATLKLDASIVPRIEQALGAAGLMHTGRRGPGLACAGRPRPAFNHRRRRDHRHQ